MAKNLNLPPPPAPQEERGFDIIIQFLYCNNLVFLLISIEVPEILIVFLKFDQQFFISLIHDLMIVAPIRYKGDRKWL